MTVADQKKLLFDFQVYLNEIGMIGSSAWEYWDKANDFIDSPTKDPDLYIQMGGRETNEPVYQLTTKVLVYLDGKAKEFNIGDCFTLAGLKLSTQGDHSPFHYNGDIIRLPNSAVKLYDGEGALDGLDKDFQFNLDNVKAGDTIRILRNSDGSGFEIGDIVKVEAVRQYNVLAYNEKERRNSFVAHSSYAIIR